MRIPKVPLPLLVESTGYFLVGRHTGLFPYMPFSLIALALFLLNGRRSTERWATVVALASIALYFLIFINFNWHGGGGFIGNRYFVMAYPAFLFLVTTIRPTWLTAVGYALGGLFVGGILATPFGAPVRNPTLQAHVRNYPFTMLPLEFSLRHQTPGYWGDLETEGWFWGRRDNFRPHGNEFLLHGGTTVEIWMMMTEPLDRAVFQLKNEATDNRVVVRLGSDRQVLHFEGPGAQQVELKPGRPYKIRREREIDNHIYRLRVESQRSQIIVLETVNEQGQIRTQSFPLGVRLAYLGTPEDLARDVYHLDWEVPAMPEIVSANEIFELDVSATNTSDGTWRHKGAPRVQLSYHWLDPDGNSAVREGLRTELPMAVDAGATASVRMQILAPPTAGRYILELDAVRERVSWFSRANPEMVFRAEIEVAGVGADDLVADPELAPDGEISSDIPEP